MQGSPISIVTKSEKEILFWAVLISPLALAEVIAGTNAVANAILKDNGSEVNVSTFPLKIPYCLRASASVKNFCNPLFTVVESIFLFNDVKTALNDIGIETDNISLTVFRILFVLYILEDTISFDKSSLLIL